MHEFYPGQQLRMRYTTNYERTNPNTTSISNPSILIHPTFLFLEPKNKVGGSSPPTPASIIRFMTNNDHVAHAKSSFLISATIYGKRSIELISMSILGLLATYLQTIMWRRRKSTTISVSYQKHILSLLSFFSPLSLSLFDQDKQ